MSTFVTVGNARQPFRRLLDAVAAQIELLPAPVVVQYGHTPFALENSCAIAFLRMEEYIQHVRDAQILIMHGGAGSLIHALEAGKCPIVMPRRACYGEHVNDHQVELVEALAEQGRILSIESAAALGQAVEKVLLREHATCSGPQAPRSTGAPDMVQLIRTVLAKLAGA